MSELVLNKARRATMANMAMLYAGRMSGVLVAFIFLPLYSRLLGPEQFGMVAVVLSLQALLMMLDFGMSTLISRDIAAAESKPTEILKLIRTAELSLSGFYVFLVAGTAVFKTFGGLPSVGLSTGLAAVVLFWVLVLQNLYYSAMLARRAYSSASTVQLVGVAIRAGATAYVLADVSATLTAFIVTQLVTGAIHFWVTRRYCSELFDTGYAVKQSVPMPTMIDCFNLLKQGRSLALFAAAGAAVMQLDKPIVSMLVSPSSVAPYFLATTLCMVPMSVLAGPVSQYFQPIILNGVVKRGADQARHALKHFVVALLLVTALPSICFWLFRTPMIDLWMGPNASNTTIAHFVKILLPGFALGALGFIPYTLLLSARDFKFQAVLSGSMTVVTLIGAAFYAWLQNVEGVCYVYAIYHGASTLLFWLRASRLSSTKELAKYSFALAMKIMATLGLIAGIIQFIS